MSRSSGTGPTCRGLLIVCLTWAGLLSPIALNGQAPEWASARVGPTLRPRHTQTPGLRAVTHWRSQLPAGADRLDLGGARLSVPRVAAGRRQERSGGGSRWKRGLLIGGVAGVLFGLAAHALVDSLPCDTCSGTGSDSAADGTRLEFALVFGLAGGGLGALLGATLGR